MAPDPWWLDEGASRFARDGANRRCQALVGTRCVGTRCQPIRAASPRKFEAVGSDLSRYVSSPPVRPSRVVGRGHLPHGAGAAPAAALAAPARLDARRPRPGSSSLPGRHPRLRLSLQPLPSVGDRLGRPALGAVHELPELQPRSRGGPARRLAGEVLGSKVPGDPGFRRGRGPGRSPALRPRPRREGGARRLTARLARRSLRARPTRREATHRPLDRSHPRARQPA